MYGETCTDAYIFITEHTNKPIMILSSPDHLTALDYNEKTPSLIGGGCYRGEVCIWDDRSGQDPEVVTSFESSHQDAVYFLRWIGKIGTEFFTGSADGFVKWWDMRNMKDPVNTFLLLPNETTNPECSLGINCFIQILGWYRPGKCCELQNAAQTRKSRDDSW